MFKCQSVFQAPIDKAVGGEKGRQGCRHIALQFQGWRDVVLFLGLVEILVIGFQRYVFQFGQEVTEDHFSGHNIFAEPNHTASEDRKKIVKLIGDLHCLARM